jgi:hypothetical protein
MEWKIEIRVPRVRALGDSKQAMRAAHGKEVAWLCLFSSEGFFLENKPGGETISVLHAFSRTNPMCGLDPWITAPSKFCSKPL